MTIHGGLGLDVKMSYWLDTKGVLATMNRADFITSACGYFLDLLRDNGVDLGGRSGIIENGIDAATLSETEPPGEREYDGVLRMVFLGGDRYLKGGDLLAQALGLVVNENRRTDVHLTVLRNVHRTSDMYRRLRADRLLEYVDLVGYVTNKGHLGYIKAGDLFVLPSRSEGIANTLMEAIGLGKAVLATDVGGTSEVVAHGINGYLCRPSPESIAEGILYFLQNPAKLGEFGQRNRELRSRFLWPGIVARYESLYERLLTDG
jgi:glycosyltransferase involved in cell wall biosynthesis